MPSRAVRLGRTFLNTSCGQTGSVNLVIVGISAIFVGHDVSWPEYPKTPGNGDDNPVKRI